MGQAVQHGQKGRGTLRTLELSRFIAALMVMLCHVVPYANLHAATPADRVFGAMLFPGSLGVQYFFVLSGFVMASAHYGDFGKLGAVPMFWWRRICRIYPVYWLALCIPGYYLLRGITPAIGLHMALLDPFFDPQGQEFIPTAWTLRYEMTFYIMFGLCLLPYIGKPLLGIWIALTFWHCVDPTLQLLHPPRSMPFYWFIHYHATRFVSFLDFYFFGGLAAGFAYVKWRPGRRAGMALLGVSLAVLLAILPVEDWGYDYSAMPAFIAVMALVIGGNILGLAVMERNGLFRLGGYAGWAGAMSYPLYLFHAPMLLFINNSFPWGPHHMVSLYARFTLICAAIFGVTGLVTFCYDQPLQRALRRLTKSLWSQPAAGTPIPPGAGGSSWAG